MSEFLNQLSRLGRSLLREIDPSPPTIPPDQITAATVAQTIKSCIDIDPRVPIDHLAPPGGRTFDIGTLLANMGHIRTWTWQDQMETFPRAYHATRAGLKQLVQGGVLTEVETDDPREPTWYQISDQEALNQFLSQQDPDQHP